MTWVQDGIFAAGGKSLPSLWADFAAQTGTSAVVHLRPRSPARFDGPPPAVFLWLTIDDEADAGQDDRLLVASFVRGCIAEGRRVLLHAEAGRHRTRWCYVAYRILDGSTPEAAVRRASRPPWMAPYRTDEAGWETFARQVRRGEAPPGRAHPPGVQIG